MADKILLIDRWFSGQVRDDKSRMVGAASNIEEVDIFSNQDYIQAEQVFSADSMPASTEIYAKTAGDDDVVYGYGKETAAGKVRIVSVASGGTNDPSTFSTLFTSADSTNLATIISDFKFFRTAEASNPTSLYYIKGASTSWYIARYNIGAAEEQRWTGSAWSATGSWDSNSQLTGLTGSFMRPTMKVIFGELFICHGQYIAKIDSDGVFTEKAWTAPKEWEAIDLEPVSDVSVVLARNKNKLVNSSKGFWWDLTATATFDDSFPIPTGGPQWIANNNERITIFCAINGMGRFYQLSSPNPGAVVLPVPGVVVNNIAAETTTQPISMSKMVATKDKILYFHLYKTDKTGMYALGQLDPDKPNAFLLSKKFSTGDYSTHKPTSLLIQGPNFYADYYDGSANVSVRCEANNSPARSSQAVWESVWLDDNEPLKEKDCIRAYVATYPLAASTSVALSLASDYSASYTEIKRADNTAFNTLNGLLGMFRPAAGINKRLFKVKLAFTSNGVNSPKVTAVGLRLKIKSYDG